MGTRSWLNLALLTLVGGLGALAYFQPGKGGSSETKPPIIQSRPEQIDRVRLLPRKGKEITLVRKQGGWRMTQPRQLLANSSRVDSILDLLTAKSQGTVEVTKEREERFGLKAPAWVVKIDQHRLALGGDHPIKPQRYLRVDDTVHLVSESAVRSIKSNWPAYASQQLLPSGAQLTRLDLPEVTLTKAPKGQWKAQDSQELKAKTASETADAWLKRRAFALEGIKEPSKGPTATLHFEGNTEPIRYVVQNTDPQLELARPDLGLLYRLPKDLVDPLLYPRRATKETTHSSGSFPGKPKMPMPGNPKQGQN